MPSDVRIAVRTAATSMTSSSNSGQCQLRPADRVVERIGQRRGPARCAGNTWRWSPEFLSASSRRHRLPPRVRKPSWARDSAVRRGRSPLPAGFRAGFFSLPRSAPERNVDRGIGVDLPQHGRRTCDVDGGSSLAFSSSNVAIASPRLKRLGCLVPQLAQRVPRPTVFASLFDFVVERNGARLNPRVTPLLRQSGQLLRTTGSQKKVHLKFHPPGQRNAIYTKAGSSDPPPSRPFNPVIGGDTGPRSRDRPGIGNNPSQYWSERGPVINVCASRARPRKLLGCARKPR